MRFEANLYFSFYLQYSNKIKSEKSCLRYLKSGFMTQIKKVQSKFFFCFSVNFGSRSIIMSLTTSITIADFETLQNNIHQNILVTLNQFFADCLRKNCLFSIVYEDGRVLITVDGVKLDPQITPVI